MIRLAWMFLTTYLAHWLHSGSIAHKQKPDRRLILLTSWCGMRGVVTLASALSLPFSVLEQRHFPFLALMIFTSFSVIIFFLIVQGLRLPYLIRALGITQPDTDEMKASALRVQLANRVLHHIQTNYQEEARTLQPFIRQREQYEDIVKQPTISRSKQTSDLVVIEIRYRQLRQELINIQRTELDDLRKGHTFSEALIRQEEHELDIEQVAIS